MISIIIPLHDSYTTVIRCMDSINRSAAAADVEVEAIFILDGPDQRTSEAIQDHQASPFVKRVIKTQQHSGIAAARNRGVAEATNSLVTFLDADDELTSERLHFAKSNVISGIVIGHQELAQTDRLPPGLHESAASSSRIPYITSLITTRHVLDQLGGFEGALTFGDDWDLVLRARRSNVPIYIIDEVWVMRHIDERNASRDTKTLASDYFAAIRTHLRETSSQPSSGEP